VRLVKGSFPRDLPKLPAGSFDAVTALAVVEHVPESELPLWPETIARLVVPNGLLIITVPAPTVDPILHVLMRLNLVAGIAAHQHHRFQLSSLDHIFTAPLWQRAKHRTFQLGLNHLYVFERAPAGRGAALAEMPPGEQLHVDRRDLRQHGLHLLAALKEGLDGSQHGRGHVSHPRAAASRAQIEVGPMQTACCAPACRFPAPAGLLHQ
jgi:hypothetical protein